MPRHNHSKMSRHRRRKSAIARDRSADRLAAMTRRKPAWRDAKKDMTVAFGDAE